MLFKKKKLIGLDVGASAIKLAELDNVKKAPHLVSFGMAPTPKESSGAKEVFPQEQLAEAIRNLVKEVKTKRRRVATAIWDSSVIVKKISILKADESLIEEQIRYEAEQYIPHDINQVSLDFEILKSSDPQSDTVDVLLVAAFEESALKCVETITMAGLECSVLDVKGFALANCFEVNYGASQGQVVGLLNVGAHETSFVIFENGEIVFCREVPVGGDTYTGDLQKVLGVSFEEAESLKISLSEDAAAPEEAYKVVKSIHEIICDEISGTLDFFLNTSSAESLDRCFITGGGARVPGFLEAMSKIAPCEELDPFRKISFNKKIFSSEYIQQIKPFSAVAIGLGLREEEKT
ncbi:MAG: type IV pilus assembly protein PilM [Bdellovibrio sp.]|nr:MAG: type IV pilus assembly protein PilM [Bdellovibrio sp.]